MIKNRKTRPGNIGELIERLQTEQGVQSEVLCRGICSRSAMDRIAAGERRPDLFLLQALLTRLGKSADVFEKMITNREYDLLKLRREIEILLIERNYASAKKKLAEYEKQRESGKSLHKQYIYKIYAILKEKEEKNAEESLLYVKKALMETGINPDNLRIEGTLFSTDEIKLLIMHQEKERSRDTVNALQFLGRLEWYVGKIFTIEREKAILLLGIYYVEALIWKEKKFYRPMREICEEALILSGESGIHEALFAFLSLMAKGRREGAVIWILKMYRECGMDFRDTPYLLWSNPSHQDIYLLAELLRKKRLEKGWSQERLADLAKTEQKTISKIERGKEVPGRQLFYNIRGALGFTQSYYFSSFLPAYDCELLEKREQIAEYLLHNYLDAAFSLFLDVKKRMGEKIGEKMQYFIWMEALLKLLQGRLTLEEAEEHFYIALSYSLNENQVLQLEKCMLTRQEAMIFVSMAFVLSKRRENEESIKILNAVLDGLKDSGVNLCFRTESVWVMLTLSAVLFENRQYPEAVSICGEGLKLSLLCGMGRYAGNFLLIKAKAFEQMYGELLTDEQRRRICEWRKEACYMSKWMKNNKNCEEIALYYETVFDVKMEE